MSKPITITYEDKKYELEFTRAAVENMERNGFDIEEVRKHPVITIPALFRGAFFAHQRFNLDKIPYNEIWSALPNKGELIAKLIEMYTEPIAALTDEPEDGGKGNANWTAEW